MLWHSYALIRGALLTLEQVPLPGLVNSYWCKELTARVLFTHKPTNLGFTAQSLPSHLGHHSPAVINPGQSARQLVYSSCVLNILKWFKLANLSLYVPSCRNHNELFTQFPLFLPPHWFFLMWPPMALPASSETNYVFSGNRLLMIGLTSLQFLLIDDCSLNNTGIKHRS